MKGELPFFHFLLSSFWWEKDQEPPRYHEHCIGSTFCPQVLARPSPIPHSFVRALHALRMEGLVVAYHDRSDGGLFITLLEMAFAGHVGLDIELGPVSHHSLPCIQITGS